MALNEIKWKTEPSEGTITIAVVIAEGTSVRLGHVTSYKSFLFKRKTNLIT